MIPKTKSARSPEYLDYIRSCKCYVCEAWPIEPHHTGKGGVGLKGSDFTAIPLCPRHHRAFHDMGIETFEKKYQLAISVVVLRYLEYWLDREYEKRQIKMEELEARVIELETELENKEG